MKTVYEPRLTDLVFQNNALFDMSDFGGEDLRSDNVGKGLFPVRSSKGGTSYNWPVRQATGAAAAYSEGQAAPAPGNNTLLNASIAYSTGYFWRSVEITGHAVDAMRDEGAVIEAIDREVMDAARAIQDLINTTAMGSTFLQLAVDSAGTYAGLARGTYANWGSYEAGTVGTLARADLDDAVEALIDNDRGAREQDLVCLCPVNQITNYRALAGAGAGVPHNVPADGGVLNLGFSGQAHGLVPIFGIPDMTNTEMYFLHRPSVYWVMHRPLTFKFIQGNGDSDKVLLTCSIILVVENPQKCGKLTGITA